MLTKKCIEKALRDARTAGKPIKRADGQGLHVFVTPAGSVLWRHKFTYRDVEKLDSFGSYPEVSMADARERLMENRKMLAKGINPIEQKREAKRVEGDQFSLIAEEYLGNQADKLAKRTIDKAKWQLREFVNPTLGRRPIAEIKPQDLLAVLRKIEARGKVETAHKTKELCGRIFLYAIATGRADRNIAADLKGALKPRVVRNHPAIVDPLKFGELLRAIETFSGQPATRAALRLAPHVFLRPGELRMARWKEIDLDKSIWRIPAERMKMKRPHVVPLSRQAIAILREIEAITGQEEFVFPAIGPKSRPISENTLGTALRAIGYDSDTHVPHGFRSSASTMLHELGYISSDVEMQLAHVDSNKIRATYNQAERLKERTKMMQEWSDHLDVLRDGATVLQFKRPG